ncbi:MAG: hypothetical protein KAW12_20885 [Candidatus Aminicenantes bacterium]|nr:hypothetical protein [Candidatus Aminicenantes bacterium]
MIEAARIMEKALFVIREYREKSGIEIDRILDPNGTGLIGPANSLGLAFCHEIFTKQAQDKFGLCSICVCSTFQHSNAPSTFYKVCPYDLVLGGGFGPGTGLDYTLLIYYN